MVEFRSKDLEAFGQPASVDLNNGVNSEGDINLAVMTFYHDGVTFHRLRPGKKAREFTLNTEEFEKAMEAHQQYQQMLIDHKAAEEARIANLIAEAKALAKSVQFDYEPLNVRAKRDGDRWHVVVRAIGYERRANVEELKEVVQEALDKIKTQVEYAERFHWTGDAWNGDEWETIIASYRRVFPIESPNQQSGFWARYAFNNEAKQAEQGEPEEIAQTCKLLAESAHPADWTLHAMYPGTSNDCWSFDNGLDGDKHFSILNKPAAEMFNLINAYLIDHNIPRSASEQEAMSWDDLTLKPLSVIDDRQAPELSALPE